MTTPVLAGYALPMPNEYSVSVSYRGGELEMADGSLAIDLVASAKKRLWTLEYLLLTDAQRTNLEAGFDAIKAGYTTNNFTDISGSQYTVTRTSATQELKFELVKSVLGNRWKTSLQLREV